MTRLLSGLARSQIHVLSHRRSRSYSVIHDLAGRVQVAPAQAAVLDEEKPGGLGAERRLERPDLVAVRHLRDRITAVERLGPQQPGG